MNNYLITVSGLDRPGITAYMMDIVVKENCKIKDIGQAVTHGLLSLSFLIETPTSEDPSLLKELLFAANKMDLKLEYQQIKNQKDITPIIGNKFVLSCVSTRTITPKFIRDTAQILAKYNANIIRIDNITPGKFKCLEISTSIPKEIDESKIKKEVMQISQNHNLDMAFLKDNIYRRSKRLISFDMDSTLIQNEVIDELAKEHGIEEEIKSITEKAMNGEIDYSESIKKRVSKLKGLKVDNLQIILKRLVLTQGAEEFISTVKSLGYKVALISGGFTYFADHLKTLLNLDYAFANELEIKNGKLTGNILGTIIDPKQKALILKTIAQQEKIAIEQTVAIGDGANDLPMLAASGLGIAYHAKDIVRKKASHQISYGPMTSVLYFLGIN